MLLCMELIEADFDGAVLRPTHPLRLRPGERVGLVIVRRPDASRWNLEKLAKASEDDDRALSEEGLAEWADALD